MKFFVLITSFLLFCLVSPDLSEIRKNYPLATNNGEITQSMYDALSSITKDDKAILLAYKGGITTLMAKHAKGIKEKKAFFQQGVALLDQAVAQASDNIEIRYIRLGVQENAPKFLKYSGHIETDKRFILEHFSSEAQQEIKGIIKNYVQQSSAFSAAEKQLF